MFWLKAIRLAAGIKLSLMLDGGSFFLIQRASSKDWDFKSELNGSVEICLVDSGPKMQEISQGNGEGTGRIYANFHGRAGSEGDVTTRTTVHDITWLQWSFTFWGKTLQGSEGKIWMQLWRFISSDLYRPRGFVSFAFLCKPRSCGEELPKGEDCQGVRTEIAWKSNRLTEKAESALIEYWGLKTEDWELRTEHRAPSTEHWALRAESWELGSEQIERMIAIVFACLYT